MKSKIRAAVLVAVSIAAICRAESLLRGDLVAGIRYNPIMCPAPPAVWVFSDQLAHKMDVYASGEIAVDGVGRIYVLSDLAAPLLEVFDAQFQRIRSLTLLEPSSSFAVDETGRAFIVGESGLVRIYSPEGTLVSTFPLPNVVTPVRDMSIDIAPDGCTLVYIGPNRAAERYDVCSGTALPPVASGLDAIRALRDGGFVGAIVGRIEFFDRNGRFVSDQPTPTADRVNAIAFGPDGRTMWVATGSKIFEMRVGVPAVSAQTTVSLVNILSLSVFGEQRPLASPVEPRRRSVRH